MITHECEDNWNLVIYDTDGVVAFESSEVTNPWDGTLKSGGTVVSNSSYRWELILTNAAGKQLFFTDQVKVEK
jgi:Pyruvate/2-oxoacid:ferredoxin oxidoreductase gamma subunit